MTAITGDPYADSYGRPPGAPGRHAELMYSASRVKVRSNSIPVERVLLGAACLLFPLGLILIMLGWYGAAHNGHFYAQMSYLISGGIFGLGLSIAGGFMYFGYWLSRQIEESRRQSALTLQALGRLEDLLDAGLNARIGSAGAFPIAPGRPPARPAANVAAPVVANGSRSRRGARPSRASEVTGEIPAVAGPGLVATPRGSLLHQPTCPVVAKRDDLRHVAAGTDGFGYCTMCDAASVLG